jgi:hypothetical protein
VAERPVLDERTVADLREHVRRTAPAYADEWDPERDDVGAALVALFAGSAGGVIERLNRLPDKQFAAFLDALGFDRRPPQSARVPLTLTVAEGAPRNVFVPAGTRASAEATETRPELPFELEPGEAFEATPARLVDLYGVDPAVDQLFDHRGALPGADEGDGSDGDGEGGADSGAGGGGGAGTGAGSETGGTAPAADTASTGPARPAATLFAGEDRQTHAFYLGHPELLDLTEGATVRVGLRTSAPTVLLRDRLRWEYYGEEPPKAGAEPVETWHRLDPTGATPVPPEAETVEEVVASLEPVLREAGYRRAELSPDARTALAEQVAVEVFEEGRSLPSNLLATDGIDPELSDAIRAAFRSAVAADPAVPGAGTERLQTLTFTLGGTPTEHEVGGTKGRWLRACVPEGRVPGRAFDVTYAEALLGLGTAARDLDPDHLLAGDVPLPTDGATGSLVVVPFGEEPQRTDAFYVASTEAFTKRDRTVELAFDGGTNHSGRLDDDDGAGGHLLDPELSWEYWDGTAWDGLDLLADTTARLTRAGTVRFSVPDDLEPTTVSGHEGHWVRVRLTGGHYGKARFTPVDADADGEPDFYRRNTADVLPPRYDGVSVRLPGEGGTPSTTPTDVLVENALTVERVPAAPSTPVRPFRSLPDGTQTLYFGFDAPLTDGPIALFLAATDRAFPTSFYPRVRWEYCSAPERDEWTPLDVRDGTEGLTERGIVRLTFPGETTPVARFGRTRHWVRARLDGDQFVGTLFVPAGPVGGGSGVPAGTGAIGGTAGGAGASSGASGSGDGVGTGTGSGDANGGADCSGAGTETVLPACGATVETTPPAGLPTAEPPSIRGVYPNTGWAANVRTVRRELLGSSDGTPDQRFAVASPPVVDATVEVDELTARSEGQRETLLAEQPDRVDLETGPDGEPRRFWVTWHEVSDFLDSGPDDRHYLVDRTAGTVRFGDGRTGAIPPVGRDSVRTTYRTGGGAAGNVPAGSVTDLVSSLAFVDEVTNPAPGDGGADVETTAAVLDRGPMELRDRNRAVVDVDYERLARAASRKLARTRCLPAMNRAGARELGWVTLLLVPASGQAKPTPSAELRGQVERFVAARAPATLVAGDRLVVRGPSYVAASVETELVTVPGASVGTVEADAAGALAAFLHPLTGGPAGEGWPFGELPCRADLYGRLERVAGVDHVADLTLRFRDSGAAVTATEGEDPPSVAPDALVYGGTHAVTARGGD